MLSARLVKMIEDHAEQLTRGVFDDLQVNPRTAAYHKLPREEVHYRVYEVYRNLGGWLGHKSDEIIETVYGELGRTRSAEGIPLSEVVYALILTKYRLRDYIRTAGLVDSAVELYQEQELQVLVGQFFDKAIFYTVKGYEGKAAPQRAATSATRARQ